MKHNERYALWYFHLTNAHKCHEQGYPEAAVWLHLLEAECVRWQPERTAKQREQQKLASLLWQLEGIKGQFGQLAYRIREADIQGYHDCQTGKACAKNAADRVRNAMKLLTKDLTRHY